MAYWSPLTWDKEYQESQRTNSKTLKAMIVVKMAINLKWSYLYQFMTHKRLLYFSWIAALNTHNWRTKLAQKWEIVVSRGLAFTHKNPLADWQSPAHTQRIATAYRGGWFGLVYSSVHNFGLWNFPEQDFNQQKII